MKIPFTRSGQLTQRLTLYPELAKAGIEFRKIAEACCVRIPASGMANGIDPAEAVERAAVATVAALEKPNGPKGSNVANYLVAIFKAYATGKADLPESEGLSRFGVLLELDQIAKADAELEAARAKAAKRKPPNPTLPKLALGKLGPRPAVDAFPLTGPGPTRPKLKPRRGAIELETTEPLKDALPSLDTLREYRDIVKQNEGAA